MQLERMENVTESHVAVKPSLVSGNGLFATRSLPAGELVLQLKRPLVGVLDTPRLEDTCSNCFAWSSDSDGNDMQLVLGNSTAVTATTTVNACVGCRKVKYCSKVCMLTIVSQMPPYHPSCFYPLLAFFFLSLGYVPSRECIAISTGCTVMV